MGALGLGLGLGLAAGLSPGPLLALVLREALRHGPGAGARAALAPLLTDGPVVLAAWFLAGRLDPKGLWPLGLLGGAYLAYAGARGLLTPAGAGAAPAPKSLRAAVVANLTNPQMYLFWFTVGLPLLAGLGRGAGPFLLGFYLALVGSKAALALAAGRAGQKLRVLARAGDLLLLGVGVGLLIRWWP